LLGNLVHLNDVEKYMSSKDTLVDLLQVRLEGERLAIAEQWAHPKGTTTRHFVIDELLPADVSERIFEAFPRDGGGFFSRESFREKKRTSARLESYDPILSDITYAFQDPRIVKLVSDLVGFGDIEPDPKLYAGGLSMMFKGDFLNPHIDNSHDAVRSRYRRLNLLYYVSPNWVFGNGGNFELWDKAKLVPKTLIAKANRLVVMETNKTSWHSVSPVIADTARCCVSNYYFSEISPDETDYFHVTSFSGRPEEHLKRAIGVVDNALRNVVSKTLGFGRGRREMSSPSDAGPKRDQGFTSPLP
jgi:Rps23 Pro-64 3,4-dihydroxylase Tpa1-like proline 4-hydroxylase